MSNKLESIVKILLSHLDDNPHGIPATDVRQIMRDNKALQEKERLDELVDRAIEFALDRWLIDKVIDSPKYKDNVPVGSHTWLLRKPNEQESEELRSLPEVEQAYLRLLHSCEDPKSLGLMEESEVVQRLRQQGFDIEDPPHITGRTSISFRKDGDELVSWCRIIPEYEKTEEAKQAIRELEEKDMS